MPRGALRRQVAAGQRHRRDERDRGRRDGDEQRGDQVGVGERRRLARAEAAREAVGDDVEALDRERQRDALGQTSQSRLRRRRPAAPTPRRRDEARQRDRRARARRSGRGPSRTPARRASTSERDHDEAGDRADAVAERRRPVVVEGGERARRDPGVDLRRRRGDEPRQQLGGARLRLRVARQQPGDGSAARRSRRDRRARAGGRARAPRSRPRAPSRPASCARANSGSTTTRSALATRTTAT